MNGISEGCGDDSRTIYAKPFPKSVTESKVRDLFEVFGRVTAVKLRRDASTQAFRGSVYVEFENESSAARAVQHPPLQLGSSSEHLQVLFKTDYERKVAAGLQGSHSNKRGRTESGAPSTSGVATPTTTATAADSSASYWQHVAEEREKRIIDLEEQLQQEKDSSSNMLHRLTQAQHAMEDALSKEQAVNRKLLSKDVEIGSLKGEVSALRSQMHSKLDSVGTQYKARIHELELQVQLLKDELLSLKQSKGKEGRIKVMTPPPRDELDDL